MRIGTLLTELGVLTPDQVDEALRQQQSTGEPLGLICERLFGVPPVMIERAWAEQYARIAQHVNPLEEPFDLSVQGVVTARQAWQFRVLPLRCDEHGCLVVATTAADLPRALRFATRVVGRPVYLVLSDPDLLEEAIGRRYPLAGLSGKSVAKLVAKLAAE